MNLGRKQTEHFDADEPLDEVDWFDGQEERLGALDAALPPPTTPRRLVASLAVFALGLSGAGSLGLAAYRHDRAVDAAAAALRLGPADVTDTGSGSGAADSGTTSRSAESWRLEPTAPVTVQVANQGPDSIDLLGGAGLTGPAIVGTAGLQPSGASTLRPGQRGKLTGSVTVDCAIPGLSVGAPSADPDSPQTLSVRARTADGKIRRVAVLVESGGQSVRDRVCAQQGQPVDATFGAGGFDQARHSFTMTVSVHARSAQTLDYSLRAGYVVGGVTIPPSLVQDLRTTLTPDGLPALGSLSTTAADALLPGAGLADPTVAGTTAGTLTPGSTSGATFTVHLTSCPSQVSASSPTALQFMVFLTEHGKAAYFQPYAVPLPQVVARVCGLALEN